MKMSDTISELLPALCKAQCDITTAKKDKTNPHLKNKYADLSSIQESCKAPLLKNGLMVIQDVSTEEASVSVCTRLIHTSGQWIEVGPLCVPLTKRDAQGIGSAITYGRRYSMSSMLCIITDDDDDANAAVSMGQNVSRFPKIEPKAEKISEAQLKDLHYALSFCTKEYILKFNENVKNLWNVDDYRNMEVKNFAGAMKSINLHIESEKNKVTTANV